MILYVVIEIILVKNLNESNYMWYGCVYIYKWIIFILYLMLNYVLKYVN